MCILILLWVNQDALNEFSYDAEVAGLSYTLSSTFRGVQVETKHVYLVYCILFSMRYA